MAFNDKVRDIGNHVAFAVNNKGTGRRGVPTAIAEIARTQESGATEQPVKLTTVGGSTRALRDLGSKRKIRSKI